MHISHKKKKTSQLLRKLLKTVVSSPSKDQAEAVQAEMEAAGGGPGRIPEVSSEVGRRWKLLFSEQNRTQPREDRIQYDQNFQEKIKLHEIAKAVYEPCEEVLNKNSWEKEEQQKKMHQKRL